MNELVRPLVGILLMILPCYAARAGDSVTYQYDGNGRIQKVTYANGTTITYNYDEAGNRLVTTQTCSKSGC